jgi:hypothetical protein
MTSLQIVPIPSVDTYFTSNTLTVQRPISDNSLNFLHTGKYIVRCSSFANNDTMPYHAFNNLSSKYWQCDFENNPDFGNTTTPETYSAAYTQNPYANSDTANSGYQGGGLKSNKWTTVIGTPTSNNYDSADSVNKDTLQIFGEWIQITIPKETNAHLYSYSILTPTPVGNAKTFPTKFIILGSDTGPDDETPGKYVWEYVDQKSFSTPKDTSDQKPIVFNLNSPNSYHYYRLVITEMPPNNSIVRISHFSLNITPKLTTNTDGFSNMDNYRAIQYFNLNDSYRQNHYVNYKISQPLTDAKMENYMLETGIARSVEDNALLLPGIFLSILAISIIVYSAKIK